MFSKFFFPLLSLLIFSCNSIENYYPEKNSKISKGMYSKYKLKLDSAYLNKNHFEIAIQLANLNGSTDKIFYHSDIGVRKNTENCFRVYEWFSLFKKHGFKVNVVQVDTIKFVELYELCIDLVGKQAFTFYEQKKEQKLQDRMKNRLKLDSTRFNMELIKELEEIEKDDQELRLKMNTEGSSQKYLDSLWAIQSIIDSINLYKIEKIINQFGYPNKTMVGYDLVIVPWLVIHHQSNIEIRDKYQELLEANTSTGLKEAFNWRSENIRLDNEISK